MKPRIFVSTVTSGFRTARTKIDHVPEFPGYEIVQQDISGNNAGMKKAKRLVVRDTENTDWQRIFLQSIADKEKQVSPGFPHGVDGNKRRPSRASRKAESPPKKADGSPKKQDPSPKKQDASSGEQDWQSKEQDWE
jgi:hypothetical protein